MNDATTKIKQQIIDKVKSSTNILVTVSRDPSVDDLSAAIGLTVMLNKIGKHATAIFSGAVPPAITFLEPDKIFEGTADSLRDFIIALDKEKADHLRYKIEGDVVKIYITPYRTTITGDDLQFSQGDFNVEIVLALGVTNKDHLDNAIAAHGSILQDVTIATFTAGTTISELGTLDWHDDAASSLCEMVTSISEAIKTDAPILDKQIATALLTGIVSATDRFSNPRTTSRTMTMAAQLMAAGADQQLIAAKLQDDHVISAAPVASIQAMPETAEAIDVPVEVSTEIPPIPAGVPGMMQINHSTSTLPEDEPVTTSTLPAEPEIAPASTLPPETPEPVAPLPTVSTHSYIAGSDNSAAALNSTLVPDDNQSIDIFADSRLTQTDSAVASKADPVVPTEDPFSSTLPPVAAAPAMPSRDSEEALAAVHSVLDTAAAEPEPAAYVPVAAPSVAQPAAAMDLPMPPPLPDFSTLPAPETPFDYSAASIAASPSAIAAGPQPQPYIPAAMPAPAPAAAAPVPDDGAMYRIPGQ